MGSKFPVMQKCNVNGPEAHPLFKYLKRNCRQFYDRQTGKIQNIPWAWAKFFLDQKGKIITYQHPRETIYNNIDLIEEMIGVKTDSSDNNIK